MGPDATDEDPADEAAAYDAQADTTVHARATLSVKTRMARALRLRAAWAGFLLIIASFAIANILSGWVITWAINERHVDEASARWMLSGVWFGKPRHSPFGSALRLLPGTD